MKKLLYFFSFFMLSNAIIYGMQQVPKASLSDTAQAYAVQRDQVQDLLIETLNSLQKPALSIDTFTKSEELKQARLRAAEKRTQEAKTKTEQRSRDSYRPYRSPYGGGYGGGGYGGGSGRSYRPTSYPGRSYGDYGGYRDSYGGGYTPTHTFPEHHDTSSTTTRPSSRDSSLLTGIDEDKKKDEKDKKSTSLSGEEKKKKDENILHASNMKDEVDDEIKKVKAERLKAAKKDPQAIESSLSKIGKNLTTIEDTLGKVSKEAKTSFKREALTSYRNAFSALPSPEDFLKEKDITALVASYNEIYKNVKEAFTQVGTKEDQESLKGKQTRFNDALEKMVSKKFSEATNTVKRIEEIRKKKATAKLSDKLKDSIGKHKTSLDEVSQKLSALKALTIIDTERLEKLNQRLKKQQENLAKAESGGAAAPAPPPPAAAP